MNEISSTPDRVAYLQVLCDSLESDVTRNKIERDLSGRREKLIVEIRGLMLTNTGEVQTQLKGLLDRVTILSVPQSATTMTPTTTTPTATVQTFPQPAAETTPPKKNFQLTIDYIRQKINYLKGDIYQNTGRNIAGRIEDITRELDKLLRDMHNHREDRAMITSVEEMQREFLQSCGAAHVRTTQASARAIPVATTTTSTAIVQTPPQPTLETRLTRNFQLEMDYIGQKIDWLKNDLSRNTGRALVGRFIDIRKELNKLLENMHIHGADRTMITWVETQQSEFIRARDAYVLTTPAETTTAIFLDIFTELQSEFRNIDKKNFESLDYLRREFINLRPKLPLEQAASAQASSQELNCLIDELHPNILYLLPHELQQHIFSFLDGYDLARQQKVSKTAQQIAKTQALWRNCCLQEFNIAVPLDGDPERVYREEAELGQYERGVSFAHLKFETNTYSLQYSEKAKIKHIKKLFTKRVNLILQPNEKLVLLVESVEIDDERLFKSINPSIRETIRIIKRLNKLP